MRHVLLALRKLLQLNLGTAVLALCFGCEQKITAPEQPPAPAVSIEDLFFYALAPNQTTAAAYMKITNNSEVMQPLNYLHSPQFEHVEIHHMFHENGMMRMRPVKRLTLGPGETYRLEPGGYHLMLFGIYDNLAPGDTFELHFEFESGFVTSARGVVRARQ